MKIATQEEIDQEEARKKAQAQEFLYVPLNQIVVSQQIRQNIDTTAESFKALMESIKARGVLEPVLAARQEDGTFLLVAGERRFKACQLLGLSTIPVRIVTQAETKADAITLQLIENMVRENLNPIDEANAYLDFLRTKIGAIDAAGIINLIMNYERDPERVDKAFAENFATISGVTGKSTRSMNNLFSLLTLPVPFQAAVREGKIGVSQGYIFAAHLDNPQLYAIFEAILKKPATNDELTKLLAKAETNETPKPRTPFLGFYSQMKTVRTAFEKGTAAFTGQDIENLVTELKTFCTLLEEQAQKQAAEAAQAALNAAANAGSATAASQKKTAKKKTAA